ncbi:hypothetical protein [Ekhidna sp.]|uniref:hypothetical protein n=1 Tax=Ekhidna sp. TaxID=2608089 RepID=UPI003C7B50B6
MSKKGNIEDRVRALSEREEKIKRQLDSDSDEMKDKAIRVGKIALVIGLVTLVGYWLFNVFADEDEEVEEKPKKKKKKRKSSDSTTSRITALLLPYLNRFLDGVLDDEEENKKEKKEIQETD